VRGPPRKCLGMCRRVTNKGEIRFGKASDRAMAKDHLNMLGPRTQWKTVFLGGGAPWVPGLFSQRSNPAFRLVPPPSPCRINTKSKHQYKN